MSVNNKEHALKGHALCSASSSERWMNCSGSVGLSREAPIEPTSIYAAEGTKAHEMAEKWLHEWLLKRGATYVVRTDLEDEMYMHVSKYVRHVKDKAEEFDKPPIVKLESRVTLNADLNMWGTADVAMTGEKGGKAHGKIIDLKYGKTKVVAKGNSQLAYYAAALLNTSSKQLEDVEVSIFQPRISNPETSFTYTFDELNIWRGSFSMACTKAMLQMLYFNEREYRLGDWCKYCPGKTICPKRLKNEWTEQDGKEF